MTNSIRTPRQGMSATSRRIAEAVDDEAWQEFRLSMKGQSTDRKLGMLEKYWMQNCRHDRMDDCDICIRVDNYIKALCRGGQLHAGESLVTALNHNWNLIIKK